MTETGIVIAVKNHLATVRFERKSACGKCGLCAFAPTDPHIDIEVKNRLEAKVGDSVEIDLSGGVVLFASLIVYLVPLFTAFIALTGAGLLHLKEIWQLAAFAIGLALGFLCLRPIDKKMVQKNKLVPKMAKIIDK